MERGIIVIVGKPSGKIDYIKPALEEEDYEVITVSGVVDALRECITFRPSTVLFDAGKHRQANDLATKYKMATGENIGIVFLTDQKVPDCQEPRGVRYVREPFIKGDLICAIREAEEVVSLKDERDMFLEQLAEYSKGLEQMVEEQTKELTEANIRLRELSVVDDLTGIRNRRYFFERLAQELNQTVRYGHPLSIMIMDLDDFKVVNDRSGHLAGDALLRDFANLVSKRLRRGETLARYGGEEFAVILPHVQIDGAMKAAEAIRVQVEEAVFSCSDTNHKITVSIGVAELDKDIKDPEEIVGRADRALYAAKNAGKNRVASWPPD